MRMDKVDVRPTTSPIYSDIPHAYAISFDSETGSTAPSAPSAPTAPSEQSSITKDLENLVRMKKDGFLSDEEFQKAKDNILNNTKENNTPTKKK